ncbi:fdrA domain protein [Candidatus Dependentiae bacterium]|nr:fdrA domain protein [Candidatus Dependentiae bacterium]
MKINTEKINKLFQSKLVVLNIGVELFHDAIKNAEGQSINMDWRSPAGGDKRLLDIINKIKDGE